MPGGHKNIRPEDGNGFDKNPQNINRAGRAKKVSIKGELEKLLQSDGTITFSGDQITKIGEEKGVKYVNIKLPTQEALAYKMLTIAMGKPDKTNTLRAIIELMEQFDGKAKQTVETKDVGNESKVTINIKGKKKLLK